MKMHYSIMYKGLIIHNFKVSNDKEAKLLADAMFNHYDELVNNDTDTIIK